MVQFKLYPNPMSLVFCVWVIWKYFFNCFDVDVPMNLNNGIKQLNNWMIVSTPKEGMNFTALHVVLFIDKYTISSTIIFEMNDTDTFNGQNYINVYKRWI